MKTFRLSWKARAALLFAAITTAASWSEEHTRMLQTPIGIGNLVFACLFCFAATYTVLAVGVLIWHGLNLAVALLAQGAARLKGSPAMKHLVIGTLLTLVVVCCVLLWLTPYSYSAGGKIRTQRLTGNAYFLYSDSNTGLTRWGRIH